MKIILIILVVLTISFFIGRKTLGAALIFFGFAALTSAAIVGLVMMIIGTVIFLTGLKK